MSHFTPWSALAGGLLIGLSAVLLLALTGRLAGISNMAHGLVDRLQGQRQDDWLWRALFLLGMVAGATVWLAGSDGPANPRQAYPSWVLVVAGLLVGYGTALGNGCTSGHGVCGLGRRSLRSLVATLTFMATGIITVFLIRHVWPL